MKLVLATKNQGKLRELKELAGNLPWLELVLAPDEFEVEETGVTFMENAVIKAQAAAKLTGLICCADDSGIAVAALNGAPGVYSARYCQGSDQDRRHKLMQAMKDVPQDKRQAAFICAMAVSAANGEILYTAEGIWPGVIALAEKGTNGFGYDPIFFLPELNKTAAELSADVKNKISHRGQALSKVLTWLMAQQDLV
jgi:XTP/dITP diphosphohydrolase